MFIKSIFHCTRQKLRQWLTTFKFITTTSQNVHTPKTSTSHNANSINVLFPFRLLSHNDDKSIISKKSTSHKVNSQNVNFLNSFFFNQNVKVIKLVFKNIYLHAHLISWYAHLINKHLNWEPPPFLSRLKRTIKRFF